MLGFQPEELTTSESTRSVRLKWVIVVDAAAPIGLQANAAVCVASATVVAVPGLLGPGGTDAAGRPHAGLPWTGCTVLAASAEQFGEPYDRALAHDEMFVADMPNSAQSNRVYDEYLAELRDTAPADIRPLAISIVGPRRTLRPCGVWLKTAIRLALRLIVLGRAACLANAVFSGKRGSTRPPPSS